MCVHQDKTLHSAVRFVDSSILEGTVLMAKRTTLRSRSGKKLYAVRDASGRFKDIQTYERAHRADMARKSKAEKRKGAKKR